MSENKNNKKALAEKLKAKLNSLEYVTMPDLISSDDYYGEILPFVFGWKVHGNVHSEKKDNFISDFSREKGDGMIYERDLEPNDWEEIVNLIEKRNEEKKQIWETKLKRINEKLNQQANLYYYWGKGDLRKNERSDGWHENKGMRGFTMFLGGNGNGLTHHLYVAEEHSVLDNFSFQTGFYLIDNDKQVEKCVGHYEGGFGCSGGETNPNNWKKYVEVGDQITITSYETTNRPIEKPEKNEQPSNNNQIIGSENKNSDRSNFNENGKKNIEVKESKIIEWLIKYFQEHKINKIKLENNQLIITHNNNEIVSRDRTNHELQNVENYLAKRGENTLELQQLLNELNSSSNPTSVSPKKDYTSYLIGGAIGVGLATLIVIGFCLWKGKKDKEKKN